MLLDPPSMVGLEYRTNTKTISLSHIRTLIKFKSVSKQWKSTIQSSSFSKRQLMYHQSQSRRDPDVLFVSHKYPCVPQPDLNALRTLVEGSGSSLVSVHVTENDVYDVCNTSCDGLICLYEYESQSIVVNPVTQWHRTFPKCNYQLLVPAETFDLTYRFGKDKISGTYKPVWLYNSAELGLNDNATSCEVFDFATNAWRYVVPTSPHLILHEQDPVYFDGSLHWFTASSEEGETMVSSMDLHTETFQVIAKAPFLEILDAYKRVLCNLDDRLCVSEKKWPNQVIWSLGSNLKTWKNIYSIDLNITAPWFEATGYASTLVAVLDKDKLLLYDRHRKVLILHDPNTKSYAFGNTFFPYGGVVCYFPSLISIL